jgi:hypothetical protein
MNPRPVVKEPTFGKAGEVAAINKCSHKWIDRRSMLFGYMRVERQCSGCGTWSSKGGSDG